MRAGLERIYKADPVNDMKFFEGCSKEMEFKAMLFSLSFFHCVLVGRKNYGPVGAPLTQSLCCVLQLQAEPFYFKICDEAVVPQHSW